MRSWLVFGFAVGLAVGCGDPEAFVCAQDRDCDRGLCEANGACSFEDQRCESGRRYGEYADGVSDQCVALDPGQVGSTSSGVGTATMVSASGTTSGVDPDPSTTATTQVGSTGEIGGSSRSDSGGPGSTDGSSGSGGFGSDPFGECGAEGNCEIEGSACMLTGGGGTLQCLPPCGRRTDCPLPATGGATPQCVMDLCILDCSAGACPDGMDCDPLFGWCVIP